MNAKYLILFIGGMLLIFTACQKDTLDVIESSPIMKPSQFITNGSTLNKNLINYEGQTAILNEDLELNAVIVARRDDLFENNELGDYYQKVFQDYAECQVILYDAEHNYYIGYKEMLSEDIKSISGTPCEACPPNPVYKIMQPNPEPIDPPCYICRWIHSVIISNKGRG